jgi:hypothetical protein
MNGRGERKRDVRQLEEGRREGEGGGRGRGREWRERLTDLEEREEEREEGVTGAVNTFLPSFTASDSTRSSRKGGRHPGTVYHSRGSGTSTVYRTAGDQELVLYTGQQGIRNYCT